MIKKIISILLLTAFSVTAQASICDVFYNLQGKGYVGPTLLVQQISANKSRFRGIAPRASLGYIDYNNNYSFAGEFILTPTSLSLSDTRYNGGSSTKTTRSFGFSLLPGGRVYRDLWGFMRLGVISSRFVSPNSSKVGAQMGLGLQTWLNKQFVLRGEYIYTFYNRVSQLGSVNSNELGLGFIYLFDI